MTRHQSSIADVIVFFEQCDMEWPIPWKTHLWQRCPTFVRCNDRLSPALEMAASKVEGLASCAAGTHEGNLGRSRVEHSNVVVLVFFGVVADLGECHASVK